MKHLARALLACLAWPVLAALPSPIRTTGGLLTGVPGTAPAALVFKGIPYAAPPVGELRWRPPQPAAAWTGTRAAELFGPGCMQKVLGTRPPWTEEFMHQGPVSEDCLYLNVWTAATRAVERRPVLVYFHGGGFNEGSGSIATYHGDHLARKGLVVITVNYRVGALGFLAHPELTAESAQRVSGNYGILDMIAALRWIRDNVSAFGGDPDRVAISGQSAGASAVHILTASPLAKGLFHRAIAQSGSSVGRSSRRLGDAEASGLKFAATHSAATLAALRAKPAADLIASGFGPVVDGWLLPDDVPAIFAAGRQNDVPTLTGLNADEGSASLAYGKMKPLEFEKQARDRYGDKAGAFLQLYPAATDADSGAAQIESARNQGRVSMYLWAERRAATSRTKAFTYYFNHVMPGPMSAHYGAFHTGEVPYVFGTLLEKPDRPWTARDREIAATISSYWVNFVRDGDPNGTGLPNWPAFQPGRTVTVEIGDRFGPIDIAPPAKLDFFRAVLSQPPKP